MQPMSHVAQLDLRETFASAASGDEAAFARIVEAFDHEMYRVCVVVCRDPTIAADAVQSAWSIAWTKLGTIRDPASLRAWLISVAVNEGRKLLKERRRRFEIPYVRPGGGTDGDANADSNIDSVDLRLALERLSPEDRALLALRYIAGFNATELAVAIGLSPPGTRARLARLLGRLRKELG